MHRRRLIIGMTLLLVSSCSTEAVNSTTTVETAPATEVTGPAATSMFGLADVVESLSGAGATVEQGDRNSGTPFSVARQLITVDGSEVAVYEYADTTARTAEEATIAMDGWSVNGTPVEWIGPPHYWSRGRVIVLYLGDDPTTINLLTAALWQALDL